MEDALRGALGPGAVSGILPGVGGTFAKLSGGAGAAGGLALAGGGVAVGVGASVGGGAAIVGGVIGAGCYEMTSPRKRKAGNQERRPPKTCRAGLKAIALMSGKTGKNLQNAY